MVDVPTISLEMQRLINPLRWGELTLDGMPDLGPSSPRADKASARFALQALKTTLAPGFREDGLVIDQEGKLFVPDDHEPGTVVIYRQETLFREEPDVPMVDATKFRRRAEPKQPTKLQEEFDDHAVISFQPTYTSGGGMMHREEIRYGVIPPDYGRKNRRLITVSGFSINQSVHERSAAEIGDLPVAKVAVDSERPYPRVERDPIPIGTARYFSGARPNKLDSPRLVRVSRLDILHIGNS